MRLALVAAMGRDRVIGVGNRLPWRLPADLRHFKQLTLGKPVLMGRRTYESIGRPLPGRHNIVLSRDPAWRPEGVTVCPTLEAALETAGPVEEAMVIGGAQFYALCLPRADRLYLTLIDHDFAGDAWFPEYRDEEWVCTAREDHGPDAEASYAYSFVTLERHRS